MYIEYKNKIKHLSIISFHFSIRYFQHGYKLSEGAFRKFFKVSFSDRFSLNYPIGKKRHLAKRLLQLLNLLFHRGLVERKLAQIAFSRKVYWEHNWHESFKFY